MLETLAVVLLVLWALGLITSYSMGGLIHILLGPGNRRDPDQGYSRPQDLIIGIRHLQKESSL